jgi:DNA-binding MarR family transcriptional regulator
MGVHLGAACAALQSVEVELPMSPEGPRPSHALRLSPDRQNPDRSVRVWFRLIRLEARMQAAVGERLRAIGVSIPQCDVLTTLTEQEGISQQELATRLYVTKGNISGLIDRLEEAGLVERRSTALDRRQHAIYLTGAGRQMAEKAIVVQHRWIASTLGRMADADLEALETQLVALRDIVREREAPAPASATKG